LSAEEELEQAARDYAAQQAGAQPAPTISPDEVAEPR
jgi:hypothetical protein